jgi:hypothetical protein
MCNKIQLNRHQITSKSRSKSQRANKPIDATETHNGTWQEYVSNPILEPTIMWHATLAL